MEIIIFDIINLHISTLKCKNKEQIEEVRVKAKNEMLS